jgi:hypothetical protein
MNKADTAKAVAEASLRENGVTLAQIETERWLTFVNKVIAPLAYAPPGLDRNTLAADLRTAEFWYRDVLVPQHEMLTDRATVELLKKLSLNLNRARAVWNELSVGNRQQLIREVDIFWPGVVGKEGSDSYLGRTRKGMFILERRSRALAREYSNGNRHSRALDALATRAKEKNGYTGTVNPNRWLIGKNLPEIFLKHFKKNIVISHSKRRTSCSGMNMKHVRTGDGLNFCQLIRPLA